MAIEYTRSIRFKVREVNVKLKLSQIEMNLIAN